MAPAATRTVLVPRVIVLEYLIFRDFLLWPTTNAAGLASATTPRAITASPTSGSAGGSAASQGSGTPATATSLAFTGSKLSGWQLAQLAISGALALLFGAS